MQACRECGRGTFSLWNNKPNLDSVTPFARSLSTVLSVRFVCSLTKNYVGKAVHALTGISLPGSELLSEMDASHSAFGLKKLAICTTKAGKLYALDMADGSIVWYVQAVIP